MNISRGRFFKLVRAEKGHIHLTELTASMLPRNRLTTPTVFYRTNAELMNEVGVGDVFLMDVISKNLETKENLYDCFVRVE